MNSKEAINEKTRQVYHAQHKRIIDDQTSMKRHLSMFTLDYFERDEGWLTGKRCLDAGCGNTAKLTISLYRLGAEHVTALDIGTEFIPSARQNAQKYGVPDEAIDFVSGSVSELPFPDQSFDFVASHGVLIHLPTVEDADQAFTELSRVTKCGGGAIHSWRPCWRFF